MQLLGLQAVPKLARRFDVELDSFSGFLNLYGTPPVGFIKAVGDCSKILDFLFEKFHITWWDVYFNSDIGLERMALAKDMELKKDDTVLEVGCGRGYFTIACARCSKVIGLDAMNGMSRHGWWKNFTESISELKLGHKTQGLKACAQSIPLREKSVDKTVAVHSIRNFQNKHAIQEALREMKRVTSAEGEIIVVENIPIARNKAQEAHLAMYKCKCSYSQGDLYYFTQEELLRMFEKEGLDEIHCEIVDYNLSATPPIFYLDASRLEQKQIEKARNDYAVAVDMIRKFGETSPPALMIKAKCTR